MPGADAETLDYYDREAAAYAECAAVSQDHPALTRFASDVPAGGTVLDFGCGPGWAAARFRELGFSVSAMDGSAELAAEAERLYGISVRVARFEDLDDVAAYDGIFASFCLLHDTRAAMPGHLARLFAALRPGGTLYVGLKEGEGEARDRLGRRYTYFTWPEMAARLAETGFAGIDHFTDSSVGMDGVEAHCLHIFARRA